MLPNEHLLYFSDSAYAPYGEKSTDFIKMRCQQLANFLISHKAKALVVACNTATTEAIADMRQHTDIPIIGVEPAIKPATKLSKTQAIGVMATHRTINSSRYRDLLAQHASQIQVYNVVCYELAEIVEQYPQGNQRSMVLIEQYTKEMRENRVDVLVLGCTHYPFLTEQIRQVMGEHITLLETGIPVALQVENILKQHSLSCTSLQQGKIEFFSSLDTPAHTDSIHQLWGRNVTVKKVDWVQ